MLDAKINMIKQQLRTEGVTDERIIHLFERIDRQHFVLKEVMDLAYADMPLPLPHNEEMLTPTVQAKMLQALNLQTEETVLEVGTGSGFLTALMASLCQGVISVEFHKDLSDWAGQNLKNQGVLNIELAVGNGASGIKLAEPVDVIVITGAVPYLSESFKACLKEDGRILAILGEGADMQMTLIQRVGAHYRSTPLFETATKTLLRAPEVERFVF